MVNGGSMWDKVVSITSRVLTSFSFLFVKIVVDKVAACTEALLNRTQQPSPGLPTCPKLLCVLV